jgi:hypothetical protein
MRFCAGWAATAFSVVHRMEARWERLDVNFVRSQSVVRSDGRQGSTRRRGSVWTLKLTSEEVAMAALVEKTGSRVVRWVRRIGRKSRTSCRWYEVDHCGIG